MNTSKNKKYIITIILFIILYMYIIGGIVARNSYILYKNKLIPIISILIASCLFIIVGINLDKITIIIYRHFVSSFAILLILSIIDVYAVIKYYTSDVYTFAKIFALLSQLIIYCVATVQLLSNVDRIIYAITDEINTKGE